jgi:hypothetical protein
VFDILQQAVDAGIAPTQSVHINTNATIWNQRYIDTLTHFKYVGLDLSIDGLNDHYDYIRYGETWSTIERNLDLYQDLVRGHSNIKMHVCVTVCVFNILYLREIQQYFEQRGMVAFFNMVHHPQHLNVRAMPDTVKQAVRQHLLSQDPNGQILSVLDFMDMPLDNQPEIWAKFWTSTKKLDLLRKQDLASTFPELWELIKTPQT